MTRGNKGKKGRVSAGLACTRAAERERSSRCLRRLQKRPQGSCVDFLRSRHAGAERTSSSAVRDVNLDHVENGDVKGADEGTSEGRRRDVRHEMCRPHARFGKAG